MEKMGGIMEALRKNPPKELAGYAVTTVTDFENSESTGLPRANILVFALENGESVIVRPSGTEPKIKTYFTTKGQGMEEAKQEKEKLAAAMKPLLA